eukprot:g19045.t1
MKNSTQFTKTLELVGDKKRFEAARKKLLERPGLDTEDGRIKRYINAMNVLNLPPFPITRKKAIDFFTALVGDEDKSFYATADDFLSTVVARLKCVDGAFDMSVEDEAAVRCDLTDDTKVVIEPDGYNSEDEEDSGTELPSGAFQIADEDKNEFQAFGGDFKYNPKSKVFMLDLKPWQSDSMQRFYNRSNSYKLNKFKGFAFIP